MFNDWISIADPIDRSLVFGNLLVQIKLDSNYNGPVSNGISHKASLSNGVEHSKPEDKKEEVQNHVADPKK